MNGRRMRIFGVMLLAVLSAVVAPAGSARAEGAVEVILDGRVEIPSSIVLLGDVAAIAGGDRQLADRLRALNLGNAPLPGQSLNISADQIRMRLRQEGLHRHVDSITGSDSVTVVRGHLEIDPRRIADAVTDHIIANAPWSAEEMTVTGVNVSGSVTVPPGRVTIFVEPPARRDYLGSVPFSVIIDVDGEYRRRIWAVASVEVTAEVVVANRPIERFRRIEPEDVSIKRVNLAEVSSSSIREMSQIMDKRARRRIAPNEVIRTDMVEFPPLVKRGDKVFIIAESPGMRITALGEARDNGAAGDTIRVVNLDSKKSLYGSVIDASTIQVDF